MQFHECTVEFGGTVRSRRTRETDALGPEAVEVFAALLRQDHNGFRESLAVPGLEHWEVQFTSEDRGSGLVTFYSRGLPLTTTALLSGIDPEGDRKTTRALQGLVVQLSRGTPREPGFALAAEAQRPLAINLVIPLSADPALGAELGIVADAETCFAAAYFLSLGPKRRRK